MSPESKPQSPQTASKGASGTRGRKGANKSAQAKSKPRVRSVLIEPRDNEPPRVSVSVEYEGEAPGMKALKKLTTDVLHDVCRAGEYVDLGYKHQQRSRELVQSFECREKGEGGG